ncbi:DUF1285 domain-containing protein [Roseicitreum antarcticum]|uniref:Proteophosphoglycan n=1 Tax=Roseicitreum antarcticum TaxID=564137 RepID=A0A1H3B208_9RHOB|nr:DUF1285 domain-containing protein [Roseicitreum antarcticum]SDX35434.1 hypothetical protein SAMN04488238_107206 [Roseicitreum antarcticum]
MAKHTNGQNIVTPSAQSIAASVSAATNGAAENGKLPPVHLWNPPFCGDIDIRIARDGTWYHEGSPITRPAMVRLFSTILRREGEAYFLVTPVEKLGIQVEDAPFVAIDFEQAGTDDTPSLTFVTNVGDRVHLGADHPLRVAIDPGTDAPSPYIMVRDGLEALIDRKSFYRLVDLGTDHEVNGISWFGIWSGEQFFALAPSDALD